MPKPVRKPSRSKIISVYNALLKAEAFVSTVSASPDIVKLPKTTLVQLVAARKKVQRLM